MPESKTTLGEFPLREIIAGTRRAHLSGLTTEEIKPMRRMSDEELRALLGRMKDLFSRSPNAIDFTPEEKL